MVRFSDMLGGNDDSQGSRAAAPPARSVPIPEPVAAAEPEIEPETHDDADAPAPESPEAVLDRLTQYATSTRASDEPATTPEPSDDAAAAQEPLTPVCDDLLPRPKGDTRKRRRK